MKVLPEIKASKGAQRKKKNLLQKAEPPDSTSNKNPLLETEDTETKCKSPFKKLRNDSYSDKP